MKLEQVLKIAEKLATNAHKEQTDKAGKPYISHCQESLSRVIVKQ